MHTSPHHDHARLQPGRDDGIVAIRSGNLHRLSPDSHAGFVQHSDGAAVAII